VFKSSIKCQRHNPSFACELKYAGEGGSPCRKKTKREEWTPQNPKPWKIQPVTEPQRAAETLKFIFDHFLIFLSYTRFNEPAIPHIDLLPFQYFLIFFLRGLSR